MTRIWIPRRRKSIVKKAAMILCMTAFIASTMPTVALANSLGEDQQLQVEQDYSLVCEANLNNLNGKNIFESRSSMEVEFNEQAPPTRTPTTAPSQSPSLSVPCSNPFSNPRGSYTSSIAPCTISFHNEDEGAQPMNPLGANRKRYHDQTDDENWAYYRGTSDVCGTENKIGEAKEYVASWPDECVGDFARCYDLRDPNHLMCQGLKKLLGGLRDRRRLEELSDSEHDSSSYLPWTTRGLHDALVPPGTTHVSIDCTVDKEAVLENFQRQVDFQHEMIEERVSATKRQTLFVVVSILAAVLITVVAISQLVVQPIVGAIGDACGSRRQEQNEEDDEGNHQLVSLVSHTSGFRLEVIDGDDDVEVDDEEGSFHVQGNIETFSEEIETQSFSDTIQQIPVDVDVVPIVPATIIPMEAIHAEVIEDGITYYP